MKIEAECLFQSVWEFLDNPLLVLNTNQVIKEHTFWQPRTDTISYKNTVEAQEYSCEGEDKKNV